MSSATAQMPCNRTHCYARSDRCPGLDCETAFAALYQDRCVARLGLSAQSYTLSRMIGRLDARIRQQCRLTHYERAGTALFDIRTADNVVQNQQSRVLQCQIGCKECAITNLQASIATLAEKVVIARLLHRMMRRYRRENLLGGT